MYPRLTVSECPNCGAPLNAEAIEDPAKPTCPFCHSLLPVASEPPPPLRTGSTFTFNQDPAALRRIRRTGRRALLFGILGTVVLVAAGVALPLVVTSSVKGSGSSSYSLLGNVTAAPASVGADFAYVIAPNVSATESAVLRLVNTGTHKIVWSSLAISMANGSSPTVVVAGNAVIVVAGTDVMAFAAATGTRLWQSSVTNDLQVRTADDGLPGNTSDCLVGCAIVIGSDLITLAKDGTVQSFAAATGAQLWSRHLADTPTFFQAAGGYAAIVSSPKAGTYQLLMFNPTTGAERAVSPGCATDEDGDQATPDTDSGFFISPEGTTLTVLIDGPGGCLASYSLPTGKLLWRTAPDPDDTTIPADLTSETAVEGPGFLFWTNEVGNDRWVFAASTATGKTQQLIDTGNQNETTQLDGVIGGTLVAEIAPSYASEQPGIYGISVKTGQQLWMLPSRVTSTADDGSQSVVVSSTGIAIASCESSADGQSGSCKFEGVDPTTGDIDGTLNIVSLDPAPEVSALAGPGGEVLANVNSGTAVLFDPVSGNEDGQWPFFK